MRKLFLKVVFFYACLPIQAQIKTHNIGLPALPTCFSADIYQRVYTAESGGIVRQYDSTGRQTAYYSPAQVAEITDLEARFGMRIFAFYQDLQRFSTFNRFLQPIEYHQFNPTKIGFAQHIAWSADQSIWVWDSQDMALKKYNPITEDITLQVNLTNLEALQGISFEVMRMQEFENRLYIFDKTNQILVFDYFGNFLQALSYPSYAYLYAENIWTVAEKKLIATALYPKSEAKKQYEVAISQKPLFLYINQHVFWIFEDKTLTIWTFKQD